MSSLIGKKVNFLSLKNIVLIGGGDLMAVSAKIFKELNFNVTMIVATRHIDEKLALSNNTLADYCKELSINPHVITDINLLTKKQLSAIIPKHSLALCFGPAWVFNNQVLSEFFYGMFNINAIPIPHYLGGAHYTWQLLNKNIDGGCFFQQITVLGPEMIPPPGLFKIYNFTKGFYTLGNQQCNFARCFYTLGNTNDQFCLKFARAFAKK